ncbi:flagellar biosynthetic protein FliQ [Desulfosalsimonas propionicica]|uniref:Flagellar biosynthetic protein FliQ n=1 Tax=Desulfosalsimonas propionicica TaxID=332175 RepID=A0A7W0HKK7_9BACT|nr:flagellar biosynthesis protein FliQ [Desulfosalsimonas propionicica]MBA2881313.1 flagellar biosynthetic protein FliQ [Desulfosalsimonas propionicica]
MTEEMVVELIRRAVTAVLLAASPMMIAGLVVGLVVSIFQAATQINEQTMTFAPKIVAVLVALVIAVPWILNIVLGLAHEIFGNMIIGS